MNILYNTECAIYPGDYIPLFTTEEVAAQLQHFPAKETTPLEVMITELEDSFKVEMVVPGVKREDFLIKAIDNILTISVLHKECGLPVKEHFQSQEFNGRCFDQHIILPENADVAFISAEYKSGLLRLYVPKATYPLNNMHNRIIVY
ncbi:MAG: Hsp20/alpha crystallin family protein [Chitinophagaceae bacterium]